MKLFYLLVLIIIPSEVFSADWDPFPLNQRSYYISGNNIFSFTCDNEIIPVWPDSISDYPYSKVLLFNNNPFRNINKCNNDIYLRDKVFYCNQYYDNKKAINNQDTIFIKDNYIFQKFDYLELPEVRFYPYANIGDTWTILINKSGIFDTVSIKCIDIAYEKILGISDSVKKYLITTNINHFKSNSLHNKLIILSKNHGFIEFFPFDNLVDRMADIYPLKMIGFQNNDTEDGFKYLDFKDFFKLNIGDQLLWSYVEMLGTEYKNEKYIDSITDITDKPEFITYVFQRRFLSTPPKIQKGLAMVFYKDDFNQMLKGPSEQFYHLPNPHFNGEKNHDINLLVNTIGYGFIDEPFGGIQTKFEYELNGYELDTINCSIVSYTDTYLVYQYKTIYGLAGIKYSAFGQYERLVIGAKINNKFYGDFVLYTGIESQISNCIFFISPNPATDFISISGIETEVAFFSIINLMGEKCLSGTLLGDKINISFLPKGFYIVQINDGKKIYSQKFVK